MTASNILRSLIREIVLTPEGGSLQIDVRQVVANWLIKEEIADPALANLLTPAVHGRPDEPQPPALEDREPQDDARTAFIVARYEAGTRMLPEKYLRFRPLPSLAAA
ncbi:hypothetical protein [Labrys sp. ZIDIC5]|uniref:hypothetical protein n=1 Tax=Labrys sedimenti TaxID=3106036 RepID=UPI002ACA5441|nr:hypothetical protein [Labrys sp. ZIDIC5]MDZ5454836.1 hypothetical protein [Labrys sp. ZIDIC5]